MRSGGSRRFAVVVAATILAASSLAGCGPLSLERVRDQVAGSGGGSARILVGGPATLDPAEAGDAASAGVIAQLFETLTAFDPSLTLRPALAERWEILDAGRRIRFTLRAGLVFSDGSPLEASDVVRSWKRLFDPERPSPLASLALDVTGVADLLAGRTRSLDGLGFRADGRTVEVDLVRPSDFASVVSSPTFAVVPRGIEAIAAGDAPFVGSGAYLLDGRSASGLTLAGNPRYWAGAPAIGEIDLVTEIGGRSPVEVFADGDLDYAPISRFDAAWIGYDTALGPSLVETPSLSLDYYGFDTSRHPFDDVRVRRAFALAVDWARIVRLGSDGSATPADGMVPKGIPGRGDTGTGSGPDPDRARALLAEAGYPGGRGFPAIALVSGGTGYDGAVVAELARQLGITVDVERPADDGFLERLSTDPPAFWSLGWIADYPAPNDFLGVLLGSDSTNNYGRWRSAAFDAAIGAAAETSDPAASAAAYARAEGIVRDEAPTIPLSYGTGWALVRPGLLGARENGLGILRLAGLAWSGR